MADKQVTVYDPNSRGSVDALYKDIGGGNYAPAVSLQGSDIVLQAENDVVAAQSFTIPLGATGAAVNAVDLGKQVSGVLVSCENADGIDAATTVTVQVGYEAADTLVNLYEVNDPATQWSKAVPATGTFGFLLDHAIGIRRIRFVLSKVTTAEVVIKVRGYGTGQ